MYQYEQLLAEQWMDGCNRIARTQFYDDQPLAIQRKADSSPVTTVDQAISDYVVAVASTTGRPVLSEEKGSSADYGQDKIFVIDPIDGTNDLIQGQKRQPRSSVAAPSIGFWDTKSVMGVVSFPLLEVSITYSACVGQGAYRKHDAGRFYLQVDNTPTSGIVLVTIKQNDPAAELVVRLKEMGYIPLPVDGSVFKACVVADPGLLRLYPPYRDTVFPMRP